MKTLIDEDCIIVDEKANSWEEAIEIASKPLIEKGYIEKEYVDSMIQSVNTHGPYMVLKDYFALMHARPEDGVNRMSMSLYVSSNPINMKGKEVKIFLVLASIDNDSHLDWLKKIIEIIDSDSYEVIMNGSKAEILEVLKEGDK